MRMGTVLYLRLIYILMRRIKQLFLDSKFVDNRDTFILQTNLHSYGKT